MARPTKTGLDYYPMDVGFLRDKKVRLLRSEFGASSVLFVLYVLGKVYEGDGYFLRWDKDELLLAADELREQPTYISEVLQGCLTRSLFDERVFQMFGVLTSAGIQRRYLRGCEKRDVITVFNEYWLLNTCSKSDVPVGIRAKLALVSVTGGNNDVNSPENSENSPGNPQSKVKESKVEESKYMPPSGGGGGGESPSSRRGRTATLTEEQRARFNRFWSTYPRKQKPGEAERAWARIDPDDALTERILAAVRDCIENDFRFRDERYTPLPSSWLDGKEWENQYGGQDNGGRQVQRGCPSWDSRPSTGFKSGV